MSEAYIIGLRGEPLYEGKKKADQKQDYANKIRYKAMKFKFH